ncbi:MAG TPA: hypothetical protein VGD59_03265 [Acidisarcina sp.]
MQSNSFARKLGIGVRVASNILRERSRALQQPEGTSTASGASVTAAAPEVTSRGVEAVASAPSESGVPFTASVLSGKAAVKTGSRSRVAAQKTRAVGHASRRFGQAVWGPFAHVSGVLWLEVTGLFFGIFALFFAQSVYRLRHDYASGQGHGRFLLYSAAALLFFYFAGTSFVRARRKGRYRSR